MGYKNFKLKTQLLNLYIMKTEENKIEKTTNPSTKPPPKKDTTNPSTKPPPK